VYWKTVRESQVNDELEAAGYREVQQVELGRTLIKETDVQYENPWTEADC
jgi:hypothetical protein